MSNVNYERRKAVALAWKNEKDLVLNGKGTRNWTQNEQKEIISTGKTKGYQGHHMKSVDGHNSKAGDPNNIQFLSRSEHLAAHKGNFRNNTNGYYDPSTGKINDFGRSRANVDAKALGDPLSKAQRQDASKKAEIIKAEKKAKAQNATVNNEHTANKSKSSTQEQTQKQATTQSKTLSSQRGAEAPHVANTTTDSKTLSSQRSASGSELSSTGRSTSNGHSSSGGKSSSSGSSSSNGNSSSSGNSTSSGRGSGSSHGR